MIKSRTEVGDYYVDGLLTDDFFEAMSYARHKLSKQPYVVVYKYITVHNDVYGSGTREVAVIHNHNFGG